MYHEHAAQPRPVSSGVRMKLPARDRYTVESIR
jgi:hypothetical protein